MALPTALPAAIGNAKADDEGAALLGFAMFFDARLSSDQNVRCASCHQPERSFGDGRPTSLGLGQLPVDRNSPSIFTAAWHRWQMWDGRADTLWTQPLMAIENPREMNFTRLELAHRVAQSFRAGYESVFGALPPLEDGARFPPKGKPGDAAFDGMAASDQFEINRVAANVGKAFEAYMRRDAHQRGRFDAFVLGDATALTAQEQRGFAVFFKAGCSGCHSGPTLTDDDFHVVGVPPAEGKSPERARAAALELLATSPFAVNGPFHDGPSVTPNPSPQPRDEPTLRPSRVTKAPTTPRRCATARARPRTVTTEPSRHSKPWSTFIWLGARAWSTANCNPSCSRPPSATTCWPSCARSTPKTLRLRGTTGLIAKARAKEGRTTE